MIFELCAGLVIDNRATCKWNIRPYGPKLGYCDDKWEAIEISSYQSNDAYTEYYKDCN